MRDLAPPFHCELHTSLSAFPPWLQQAVTVMTVLSQPSVVALCRYGWPGQARP